jgi:predicted nucleotidyltransferase
MRKDSLGSVRITFPALSREELVERLRQGIASLAADLPLRSAILFGSCATGRATAFSDIDLLVVYGGPRRVDAYKMVRRHVGLRGLEPHVYNQEEAEQLRATLDRMTVGGVTLL